MVTKFLITLCDSRNKDDEYILEFNLINSSIVKKWHAKVIDAIARGYTIDDPERFYGFNEYHEDVKIAFERINACINTINSHKKIINRVLTDIRDTDTLNYLHHIFEKYHGLLDQQTGEFYVNAPITVRKALADLNIAVHRVETVLYGNPKYFVTTYFGLPKTDKFSIEDFEYMTCKHEFGGLYLNYVEIGKPIEDLVRDKDEYIGDEAFKPWDHYSADFAVKFHDTSEEEANANAANCLEYYKQNYEFFKKLGYPKYTEQLRPGYIKLGELSYNNRDEIIHNIKKRQYVKQVNFI